MAWLGDQLSGVRMSLRKSSQSQVCSNVVCVCVCVCVCVFVFVCVCV